MKKALATLALPLGMLAFTTPAAVLAQGDDDNSEATAKKDDRSKKICRTFKVTGSRLSKYRECRTAAGWDQWEAEQRQSFSDTSARAAAQDSGN